MASSMQSFCPTREAELGELVRAERKLLPVGARSKNALLANDEAASFVDMRGLSGVVTYDSSEFLITARAGTTIDELVHVLAERGQYLPFDPMLASRGATLGGTVASGLSGPSRMLYGSIRDFIVEVAMLDGLGRSVRGGGKVVKNAAGFDFPKMVVGSYGRLGIMTEITLKVFPKPPGTLTLLWDAPDMNSCVKAIARLLGRCLPIAALDIDPPGSMLVRLAGPADALRTVAGRVEELVGEKLVYMADPLVEQRLWLDRTELGWIDSRDLFVKVATNLHQFEPLVSRLQDLPGARMTVTSCAGGVTWLSFDAGQPLRTLDQLLIDLGLSGVVVCGDVERLTLLGERKWTRFAARIQQALDPDRRFPCFVSSEQDGVE